MSGWVYVLQNKGGKYYVGSTNDLERRILEHQQKKNLATKFDETWVCIYSRIYDTLAQARKVEFWIKSMKSRSIIERYNTGEVFTIES